MEKILSVCRRRFRKKRVRQSVPGDTDEENDNGE